MVHTYTHLLVHYIFSTKNREKLIHTNLQDRIWTYLAGIAKTNQILPIAVGGTQDHVHMLLGIPPTLSASKSIQLLKGGSSKWIHEEFLALKNFAWQEGYGAFSVSISQKTSTINYIQNQHNHHRNMSFKEEYLAFLKKHHLEYNDKYVWG